MMLLIQNKEKKHRPTNTYHFIYFLAFLYKNVEITF